MTDELIETLIQLRPDTVIELETSELTTEAYVVGSELNRAEYIDGVASPGSLLITLGIPNEEYDRLELATQTMQVVAKEPKPHTWRDAEVSTWDPEVTADGEVVEDDWRGLGTVENVEVL